MATIVGNVDVFHSTMVTIVGNVDVFCSTMVTMIVMSEMWTYVLNMLCVQPSHA